MAQLGARSLVVRRGPLTVLDGIDLTVAPGDRIGVVGANGVGKSTLLAALAGELEPSAGSVDRMPADATVGFVTQQLVVHPGETVDDVLRRRTGVDALDRELTEAGDQLAAGSAGADDRYDAALTRWMAADVPTFEERRDRTLAQIGVEVPLDRSADTLSGGQRSRLGLAAVLLGTHDLLLLDEPTNDLDFAGLELLEQFLLHDTRPQVVVSHDRAFLSRIVTSVLEIDDHSRRAARFDGGYDAWIAERATARRLAEEAYSTYVDQRDTLRRRAQREREWSTRGVRSASKQSDGDKIIRHREMQRSEQLAGKAKRTEQAMERLEVVEKPWEGWELRLDFAEAGRAGAEVAVARGAVVERGDFRLGPVDLDIRSGERVVITGPNGAGKSTLLALLLGDVAPVSGTAHLGPSVVVGRLDQARTRFSTDQPLIDLIQDETGLVLSEVRSILAKLGLDADRSSRPASTLSPGERTRAVLAVFAVQGVNCLVLDEPTNHLDLPAIEQLEVALDRFSGTVLLVSHDRRLLESVRATRRLLVEAGTVAGVT
ncbi:MAG: ABC-F family ATP-binding cassette domain-containing protein [Actinomycetota bacterium]